MTAPIRVAMWSGPRNISTALMRSWGNRPDTIVCDEPLYAFYLRRTCRQHPGRDETLATQQDDWRRARDGLLAEIPPGKAIFYQKHMAHHLLPEVDRDWLDQLTNCFLIREPRAMLMSLLKKVPDAGLADTGLPQQVEIFRHERERIGNVPPVIDSQDVLLQPASTLSQLCGAIGIEFSDAMLHWPTGLRATDGAWAPFWYAEVATTTTFQPYRRKNEDVPSEFHELLSQCQVLYEELADHRIRPT